MLESDIKKIAHSHHSAELCQAPSYLILLYFKGFFQIVIVVNCRQQNLFGEAKWQILFENVEKRMTLLRSSVGGL